MSNNTDCSTAVSGPTSDAHMNTLSEQDRKDIRTLYFRSAMINGSMQAIKRQGMGFLYSIVPLLDRYYKDDEEGRKEAFVRNVQYMNTNACTGCFLVGLTAALEKEKAEKHTVTGEVITNIKTALMGPLASIGDSLFQVTLRVIAAGIGITFAEQGSILGALIFLLIYGGTWMVVRYPLIKTGYTLGTGYLNRLFEEGLVGSITKATSIMGLTMIGALSSSLITSTLKVSFTFGDATTSLQGIIDTILPGGLSLGALFVVYWLYKYKHLSVVKIVLVLIVFGIVAAFFGIM